MTITTGSTVNYIGWQPADNAWCSGVVVLVSGQSALVDVGGVRHWVDVRNLDVANND